MYTIVKRTLACCLAAGLLCGCTLTERLESANSSLTAITSDSQRETADISIAYYSAEPVNPVTSASVINRIVCEAMFEGLFCLNDSFEPENVLCENYTSEGTQYTFVLKEGLTFSDGSPLTADDVVYSYRLAGRTPASPYYDRAAYIASISAVDSRTVRMTTTVPNSRFVRLLDMPIFKQGTEGETFSIGSGPFMAEKTDSGYQLTPNPNWRKGKVTGVPRIQLMSTVRADAIVSSFAAGDISLTRAERISDDPATIKGAVDVFQTPTTELHYLGVRTSYPLLADPTFRKALSMVIDREMLCRSPLQTFADPAVLPVNPQPAQVSDDSLSAQLDQAAALLAQIGITDTNGDGLVESVNAAGQREPVTLTLLCNSENTFKNNVCAQLTTMFGQLGITLTVNSVPYETYAQALENGTFDLYYGDLVMTPDFDLRTLLMTGGSLNYGRGSDAALDAKITALRGASQDTLAQAEQSLNEYLLANMPILPLAFERNQVILRSGLLKGYAVRPYQMFWEPEKWSLG